MVLCPLVLAATARIAPQATWSQAAWSQEVWPQEVSSQDAPTRLPLIPLATMPIPDNVLLSTAVGSDIDDQRVNLIATAAPLASVLRLIAEHHELNLVVAPDVAGPVTVQIRNAHLDEVLDAITGVAGFHWHRVGNLLYVTGASMGLDPRVQGKVVIVYPVDYVTAEDARVAVEGLLSPLGSVVINQSAPADQQKTREVLIVDDVASAQVRIAAVIAQLNVPPKQVLIEAHILQISLNEEERHGINLDSILRMGPGRLSISGLGFAEDSGPGLVAQFDGTDIDGLLECIREHTDSRTLASPKVSVLNHQEARIQIGQRLPYTVATTTQVTTVESVEFLEVGVVLTVTPIITDDGQVMMTVAPKVSGGVITPAGFPEEDTTEVSTTVLMPDGGGVVIGGLIREETLQSLNVVPGLHRIPLLGRLFTRKSEEVRHNELVVALVTRVMDPTACPPRMREELDLHRALPEHAMVELTGCQTCSQLIGHIHGHDNPRMIESLNPREPYPGESINPRERSTPVRAEFRP